MFDELLGRFQSENNSRSWCFHKAVHGVFQKKKKIGTELESKKMWLCSSLLHTRSRNDWSHFFDSCSQKMTPVLVKNLHSENLKPRNRIMCCSRMILFAMSRVKHFHQSA